MVSATIALMAGFVLSIRFLRCKNIKMSDFLMYDV